MVRAFRFNLNALGSLTLLVGMFLVANAVSIAVLRRRPEIATLRALGASRAAIFAAFLAEGLVIGLAGTALGEALGVAASRAALRAVAGTVSTIYAPTSRIEAADAAGPAALAAAVGLLAAVLATLVPAAEAMRVAPSPALRAGSIEGVSRRGLRPRVLLAGTAVLLAALASRAAPIDGFPLFGFAAVVLVVAALALVSPLLVRAGAALPGRLFGPAGRLGAGFFGGALAKNGIAVTALAMALGMTLAMIVTVASIRRTVRVWVESTLRSDLWIKADAGGRSGIVGDLPPEVIGLIQGVEGVDAVDPFRARDVTDPEGRPYTLAAGDFRILARAGGLPFVDGRDPRRIAESARALGEVLVSEPYARRFSAAEGSSVSLPTPEGPRPFRVAGVYRDYSNDRGTVVMDRALYLSLFGDRRVTSLAVLARPGIEPSDLRRRILAAAEGRYALTITTNRELRREVLVIFDRTFAVTRALEAIALAVAVLGVANALMSSVVERRRAFGLLRAVGASGGQIRRATLVEALLTGLTGTVAAVAAGAAFAWLLLTVINPQSFGWTVALAVPGASLLGATALVLLASVLAGIGPGRVAAAVDPAAALAEE
jgi:putative ABC transport system permease protein